MSFDQALAFTLQWEGGYVNDPNDPGGETKFGISKRAHPECDIANLTRTQAENIYRADYWDRIKGSLLPPRTASATFDFAVNSGVKVASQHLQRLVGATADGIIGPQTLAETDFHEAVDADRELAFKLVLQRVAYLTRIVDQNEALRRFMRGWMNRTHALVRELYR